MISTALNECLRSAKRLIRPGLALSRIAVSGNTAGGLQLNGGTILSGRSMAARLAGSKEIYIFCLTIGPEIETTASRLMEDGEELRGYLLDRVGSFAVESMAENLERSLGRSCRAAGLSISDRVSPGYCDMPIEEQSKLDRVLGFSLAGVRLTKASVMVPRKSISGIVGVGPKGLFAAKRRPCDNCDMERCDYRSVKAVTKS